MFYELATLACPLLSVDEAAERSKEWIDGGKGELLGCWHTEHGTLGRLLLLRGFDERETMHEERQRALLSSNPFHGRGIVDGLEMASYASFDFLPPVRPGDWGGVYEFRKYVLKPGGLPATLKGWQDAIEPAREYTKHLVINMYALDGEPHITHIWGFASLEERAALRKKFYAAKLWPPKGGPEQIHLATSTIALPLTGSRLF